MSTRKKDEGFTNIRIREETREELRAIGRYGENMDDIVRKCLAAYTAITNSGGRVVSKIVVEEPIKERSQNAQTQPQQEKNMEDVSVNPGVVSSRAGSAIRTLDEELERPQQEQPQETNQQIRPQIEQHQKNNDNIFGKPIMAPLKNGQVELNLTIPELTFPTNKEKILNGLLKSINQVNQTIDLNSDPEIRNNLKKLLEILRMNEDIVRNLLMFKKVYKDVGQIEEEIIKAPKKRLADLHIKHRPEGTLGGCKIRYGPDIIKDRMGMRLIT